MRNYKTTDKHPDLKEGVEIDSQNRLLFVDDVSFNLLQETITSWIEEGFIEEIQLPEFTIDQVRAMCIAYAEHCDESLVTKQIKDPKYFNGWFNKIYTLPCLD